MSDASGNEQQAPTPPEPTQSAGVGGDALDQYQEPVGAGGAAGPAPEPVPGPAVDPWAHRRGEPRVIAFFWTLYVLLAVAGSVTWVARFASITPDSYAPGARIMIVVLAVGATILWPMVRLSQAVPDGSVTQGGAVSSVVVDATVVLVPLHMTVWPMLFLASWPLNIVAAVAACLTVWVLLVGGVLALTQAVLAGLGHDRQAPVRVLAMLLVVTMVLAAPVALLVRSGRGVAPEAWVGMMSPLTAIADITGRGLMGPQNPVTELQWRVIGGVGLCAAFVWFLAGIRGAFVKPGKRA